MVSTIDPSNDCEALASVINYDRKSDATILSGNLFSSFRIVMCF
jgi:hypothetical protein